MRAIDFAFGPRRRASSASGIRPQENIRKRETAVRTFKARIQPDCNFILLNCSFEPSRA